MKERHMVKVAVFLFLTKIGENGKKQILLQKRINTGYMDEMYDTCASGHLDPNESIVEAIIREAKEEVNIEIAPDDISLAVTYHASEKENGIEYLRFYFNLNHDYNGKIEIGEPEKCSELLWSDIDNLPENTIWHLKKAIDAYLKKLPYIQDNF